MAECIKKLCHKAFSVPTLPRTTAAVKEPKVADFEPNSATVEPSGKAAVLSAIIGLAITRWP